MKRILHYTVAIITAVICVSCGDMFHTIQDILDEGEKIYASKIESLEIKSGHNRVKVVGKLEYGFDTKKCIVTWSPGDGKEEIDIERVNTIDDFEHIIENIPEGTYDFYITTYDAAGNSSIPQMVNAKTYGEMYINSISSRVIQSAKQRKGDLLIKLSETQTDLLKTVFEYRDRDGDLQYLDIMPQDVNIVLADWLPESNYKLTSYYVPTENSIDEFESVATGVLPALSSEKTNVIPKSDFEKILLQGDIDLSVWAGSLEKSWDGIVSNDNFAHSWEPFFTDYASFTMDIGKSANLHSFKINNITTDARLYNEGSMKNWEIYGSSTAPSADGSWDDWTLLMQCESIKPSGEPVGTLTEEDRARGAEGEIYYFAGNIPTVRYIRFKVTDVWAGNRFLVFSELTFTEYTE